MNRWTTVGEEAAYEKGYIEGRADAIQQQWIPYTPETMPQEDGEYLVTIHWKNGGYYTDLLIYKTYLKEWKDEDRIFGTVIAWMPKPQPWERDRNE